MAALCGNRSAAELAFERSAAIDDTLNCEEQFLLALAAAWLERPDAAEIHLARGLKWHAKNTLDATLDELARDALAAVRRLGDTPAGELLTRP